MSGDPRSQGGAFPATQWSLVERAKRTDPPTQREALSLLLTRYLPALRTYLSTAKRVSAERADDLLQGFVTDKIVEQNLLSQAKQERGRLRSLLMVALDRYIVSHHRSETAAKRAPVGGVGTLAEGGYDVQAPNADALQSFNVEWARGLIAEAVARTKAECEQGDRTDLWRIFDARVVGPSLYGHEPVAYQQLVEELGLATPLQACALLTTAKRMFARNLRHVAAEYAGEDEVAIESELGDLRRIVSDCRT